MVKNIRFTRALALALALAAGALGLAVAPGSAYAVASASKGAVTISAELVECPVMEMPIWVERVEITEAHRDGATVTASGRLFGTCPYHGVNADLGSFSFTHTLAVSSCAEPGAGVAYSDRGTPLHYTVGPVDHQNDVTPASAATCTEPGSVGYQHCKKCDNYFDMAGDPIAGIPDPIAPLGHTFVKNDGKSATCTEPGMKPHFVCETCGALSDEAGNTVADPADLAIPTAGHEFVNGVCTVCGEKESSQGGAAGPGKPDDGKDDGKGDGGSTGDKSEAKGPAAKDPASEKDKKEAASQKDKKEAEEKAVAQTGDAAAATAAAFAFAAAAALATVRLSAKRRASQDV